MVSFSAQLDNTRPNGEARVSGSGEAAHGARLSSSASAPSLGTRKGVSVIIDPSAPLRLDDEDSFSPQISTQSQVRSAWTSSCATSPSRPGSRGTRLSSASQRSLSGRFTHDELRCFKRVPTPTSSCDNKRDTYFKEGGSGELRKNLMNENWHTLPVLKGKFFTHPRLCDSANHMSTEKVRSQKANQARQHQVHNQKVESLPNEELTASLLDRIFPKDPTAEFKEWEMDNVEAGASTPTGNTRRGFSRSLRSGLGTKRFSASDFNSAETTRTVSVADAFENPPSFTRARADTSLPSNVGNAEVLGRPRAETAMAALFTPNNTNFSAGGAGLLGSTLGSSASPGGREALAEKQRREIMLDFRKQILEKFSTVKEGFDSFQRELPSNREMTKKEWRRILQKLEFVATVEERDTIFEMLDINNNHHVSMLEFHIAIEAAVPIRGMEDLRRRWLASGFPSMMHAISIMDEGGARSSNRLTLREFGEALSQVHVIDHVEHANVFCAISEQYDRDGKVSIGELASAIATVSPALYLEDMRHRLLKRYNGSSEKCYWDIDQDHSGIISKWEFKTRGHYRLGIQEFELEQMFSIIDCDGSGSITKGEFLCAMNMAESSLFHEDLRKKVRQRFRSMKNAFATAMEEAQNADLHQNPKLTFERFQSLLKGMEMKDEELLTLFGLIDANRDGELQIREFIKGIQLFAPSCVLEDLRLLCLQEYPDLSDAFATVDRLNPMNLEEFRQAMTALNLASDKTSDELDAVFAMLDVRNEGFVTFGKLIAALQAGGPGCRIRVPSEERDHRAMHDVKGCLLPTQKLIGDVKLQARHGLDDARQGSNDDSRSDLYESSANENSGNIKDSLGGHRPRTSPSPARHRGSMSSPGSRGSAARRQGHDGGSLSFQAWCSQRDTKRSSPSSPSAQSQTRNSNQDARAAAGGSGAHSIVGTGGEDEDASVHLSNIAPRLRALPAEDLAKYMAKLDESRVMQHKKFAEDTVSGSQQSWGRVWHSLHQCPDQKERLDVERRLLTYFQTTATKMSEDTPYLERSHSRHAIHRSVRAHTRALAQHRVPRS
mmetsp:Transcript_12456/g.20431  ORF Transcript_12456/g.20431 Transcript_12456/m.20431 type:complete len:1062 (-) Transcript_12456:21-3206(-)